MPPPTTLSKSAIAAAALALIDEDGLEAFSTRKLGARLGVEAMALYHHFPSKKLLGDWVAASLRKQVPLPPGDLGWRSWLGQAARGWRAMALAHPNAFPLLIAHTVNEDDELFAGQCRVLAGAGLSQPEAIRTARIVNAFLGGAIVFEIASPSEGAAVFERGLILILDGTARQLQRTRENAA